MKIITSELNKYRVFLPQKGQDIKNLYPEVNSYPELSALSNAELLFVWCTSCQDSPFYDYDNEESKMTYAARHVREQYKDFVMPFSKGGAPQYIKSGMSRMSSFSPDLRRLSLGIMMKTYHSLEEIVNEGVTDHKGDATKMKQYADTVVMISKEIPSLVRRIEDLFSMKPDQESESFVDDEKPMSSDSFLESKE